MDALTTCFWCSLAVLSYSYLGYPALVWLWARKRPKRARRSGARPRVSVVIVAYNEGRRIGPRIENILQQEYPADRLEVIIASDGSKDDTAGRARAIGAAQVRVVEFPLHRGKSAVLDEVIPTARGDVVVLADARQRFSPGALRALAERFADPEVGAVSGELVLERGPGGSEVAQGVDAYWRYEKFIRRNESLIDSTVGATGAIYAVRRVLFRMIPADIILDDVLVPMIIVRQGYRVLFEPRALAYDQITPSARAEFRRKVRTLAGNFQLLRRAHWLWNPRTNRLWLQLISHKLCRLLCPWFMVAAFFSNLLLIGQPAYRVLFILQLVFYAAALCGALLRNSPRRNRLVTLPYAFCLLNLAAVMGLFEWLTGRQTVTWEVTSLHPAVAGGFAGGGARPDWVAASGNHLRPK